MKPSRYNHFFDVEDGKKLAFNALRDSLAEIDAESWPIVEKLLADPDSAATPKEQELRDQLVLGQFLIDDSMDEITHMKVQDRLDRFGNRFLALTIAPTLDCNFACDYCFESRKPGRMARETEAALIKFAAGKLKKSDGVAVSWYGGEPTLCIDTIERVQQSLCELAAENNIPMTRTAIITNGYLMKRDVAERLKAAGVSQAQITLDGPQDVHDARRKLHSGKGTFSAIVENVCQTADLINVAIRVNVDRQNIARAFEVAEILDNRKVLSKVKVYYAPVQNVDGCYSRYEDQCFGIEEFSHLETDFYSSLLQRGITDIKYPTLFGGGFCTADRYNTFLVTPTGHLFKCLEEVSRGEEHAIGTIFSDKLEPRQQSNLYQYYGWDPYAKTDCLECNILPICRGGCPYRGSTENNPRRGFCATWKYHLRDMLYLRYKGRKAKGTELTQSTRLA